MLQFINALKPGHIFVLVVVFVLIFGASKLPEIAKNIGKSAKVLKKEIKDLTEEEAATDAVPAPKPADVADSITEVAEETTDKK
ncbi:twin-arginine translocase TatA/TatE family subunit [Gleimia sp. 6138-11-ORH1]|uniref:twin-arginine translocase TatA/TatE family subunit n=1 Tax=Gleimia sp. 6138-11-ORH1 TaxID=2973937 RepID=UPI0021677CF3|nr:twin-arginine translocase TatA/TatE family subunit [Gleimia sp. 6138-11-ORH1]MCS4484353.1 twin-arginine translocase TatA/TatE family subunit [Gleimia sp. 6138-11-ORH1]